jgi:carboxy-cis,cis-muconate cyclase
MKAWTSYSVTSPQTIERNASHPISGHPLAASAITNTRAIFILAAQTPPYAVYGNPFYDHAGYGNVYSTTLTGGLGENIQNYPYDENSGIHGMVFDPNEEFLYSADLRANKLWTHKKSTNGKLTLVHHQLMPNSDDHPRWVEMSQSGKYLHVLMEGSNWLAEYSINSDTHYPECARKRFSLIPDSVRKNVNNYRGDIVVKSHSGKYLFATTRSNTLSIAGYISVYRLGSGGAIEEQICLQETRSSGGHSNAVAPCPWSDKWVALTDDTVGFIEMWKWEKEELTFEVRCEVREPGFGMNAVWYD